MKVWTAIAALALVALISCGKRQPPKPASAVPPPAAGPGTKTPDIRLRPPAPSVEFTTIQKGNRSGVAARKPQVFALRTEKEWADWWAQHMAGRRPAANAPKVDFQKHMVIAAMHPCPSGGYGFAIERIGETRHSLTVVAVLDGPPPGVDVTMALTQPFQIVKVPTSPKKVELMVQSAPE